MDIRDQRQWEAAKAWMDNGMGILNCCPRFGKIKTCINIMETTRPIKVLVAFPYVDIKTGWISDMKKFATHDFDITYTTFASLKHKIKEPYDLFIIDEIQKASVGNLRVMSNLTDKKIPTIALSGTITKKTEDKIARILGLPIVYRYSIDQGVKEGILADYRINIHTVPLDSNPTGVKKSEKDRYDSFNRLMKRFEDLGKSVSFIENQIRHLIQGSRGKLNKTRELLKQYENERVLVFCGLTSIADQLEIPVYHSKKKEDSIFKDFCEGRNYNQLATIKMAEVGVTVKPINRGIINHTSGNPEDTAQKICRFLGFEWENVNKVAIIDIVCTDTEYERSRMKTALKFFDPTKVNYM